MKYLFSIRLLTHPILKDDIIWKFKNMSIFNLLYLVYVVKRERRKKKFKDFSLFRLYQMENFQYRSKR